MEPNHDSRPQDHADTIRRLEEAETRAEKLADLVTDHAESWLRQQAELGRVKAERQQAIDALRESHDWGGESAARHGYIGVREFIAAALVRLGEKPQ